MRNPFARNKLPFLLAILYSVPLLMISILCASLALDRPQIAIWRTNVNYPGVSIPSRRRPSRATSRRRRRMPRSGASGAGRSSRRSSRSASAAVFIRFGTYGVCVVDARISAIALWRHARLDTWVSATTRSATPRCDKIPVNPRQVVDEPAHRGEWEQRARDDHEPAGVDDRPGDPVRARLRARRRAAPAPRQPRAPGAHPGGGGDRALLSVEAQSELLRGRGAGGRPGRRVPQ